MEPVSGKGPSASVSRPVSSTAAFTRTRPQKLRSNNSAWKKSLKSKALAVGTFNKGARQRGTMKLFGKPFNRSPFPILLHSTLSFSVYPKVALTALGLI